MDVIVDRESYDIGDTATVLFASPFTDAEAWVTIEREQVLESRRLRIEAGATTLRIPITEELAPNAYVSILVAKGRTAEPTSVDDPGRPAIRVGYAQLRVLPEVKRLMVDVEPLTGAQPSEEIVAAEAQSDLVTYGPGDTARFDIRVRDREGVGTPSEVTLWAVDEGVLSLTGYATPDPVEMLYRERGLGVRLGSNLTSVAARIPEGQKGRRDPGGGGGDDASSILRSRFQTTAFFLGSIETDSSGYARAEARLPDNLTTFRVMALAATTGDRYGSADTSILVTRPLLARAALPRFVRPSDSLSAGVVVNQRLGIPLTVDVQAVSEGITMGADSSTSLALPALRAAEARFDYRATDGDSARFEFSVEGRPAAAEATDEEVFRDAVRVTIPIKPDHRPLASTASGAVAGVPRTVVLPLRPDVDPERSSVEVRLGTAPVSILRAMRDRLEVYAYQCTEQVSSRLFALLAMYRLDEVAGVATDDQRRQIRDGIRILEGRQRSDGALGYWNASDWSTAWLTSYAGRVLATAAAAGFEVDSTSVARLADYASRALESETPETPRYVRWTPSAPAFVLGERLMVADFLSRAGQPALAVENDLLANVSLMRWEDRVLLAEVLHRSDRAEDAAQVLTAAWDDVRIEGGKALAPDPSVDEAHYFRSPVRGTARLLSATARIEPDHPRLGALLEGLIDRARAQRSVWWNTQDYAHAALAAADLEKLQRTAALRPIRLRGAPGVVADLSAGVDTDTTLTLEGLVTSDPDGSPELRLAVGPGPEGSADASGAPVYFFVTVHQVPRATPVDPVDHGIAMERWYEDLETGEPLTEVEEGELVRVVLRVSTATDRQFVVVDDPLPAGLEAVDLSLRTVRPPGARFDGYEVTESTPRWFGRWNAGLWSPFEHQEIRDDRVLYSSSSLGAGTYQTTYVARATTVGTFVAPPAHAEEMYNPAVAGRTGGSTFTVLPRSEP